MLVASTGSAREALAALPELNRDASMKLASRLFKRTRLEPLEDGDLSFTCPPDDELYIGRFSGVSVVAAIELGLDYPSSLDAHFLREFKGQTVYLHTMHSVVDFFAFGVWREGKLERALSQAPDFGILEDIGSPLPFEVPYWSGEHPAIDPEDDDPEDPYPFPFHPLELGEAALRELFGYQLEGFIDDSLLEPEDIPLIRVKRKKSWFRFW